MRWPIDLKESIIETRCFRKDGNNVTRRKSISSVRRLALPEEGGVLKGIPS